MKKFLAMLLAVLMLVSLMTACGSKAEEPVVENNEGGEAAPEKKELIDRKHKANLFKLELMPCFEPEI